MYLSRVNKLGTKYVAEYGRLFYLKTVCRIPTQVLLCSIWLSSQTFGESDRSNSISGDSTAAGK